MIKETLKKYKIKNKCVLILDDKGMKILSKFLTVSEAINMGLLSLESISLERQPFKNYSAIYYISPSESSIEKIINDFKKAINEDENGKESLNKNYNNKSEIEDEIEEIKNYYEGKIAIMDKKIKVFEILESLYMKQIDELKNKLNKNATRKIKRFNEDVIMYDFH